MYVAGNNETYLGLHTKY